jgi:hypothetical protein
VRSLTFRLPDDIIADVHRHCRASGETISELLRRSVLQVLRPSNPTMPEIDGGRSTRFKSPYAKFRPANSPTAETTAYLKDTQPNLMTADLAALAKADALKHLAALQQNEDQSALTVAIPGSFSERKARQVTGKKPR